MSLGLLIIAWLRTDSRNDWGIEDHAEGAHLRGSGEEGGLQDSYIPELSIPCFSKIFLTDAVGEGRVKVMFHNHPSNEIGKPDYYQAQAFADWFARYLGEQGIEFIRQSH
ncbi:MAG: hypothetical protein NT003_04875 [Candidatus Magasanikbacteria bacterium]|nr:hypothetical protein [Candidatus Magasanikbacteria bacterium]